MTSSSVSLDFVESRRARVELLATEEDGREGGVKRSSDRTRTCDWLESFESLFFIGGRDISAGL